MRTTTISVPSVAVGEASSRRKTSGVTSSRSVACGSTRQRSPRETWRCSEWSSIYRNIKEFGLHRSTAPSGGRRRWSRVWLGKFVLRTVSVVKPAGGSCQMARRSEAGCFGSDTTAPFEADVSDACFPLCRARATVHRTRSRQKRSYTRDCTRGSVALARRG